MTRYDQPRHTDENGVDKRLPHSDGHLDQDQSGRSRSLPGQGGNETDPSRSGQSSRPRMTPIVVTG